ncbi:MAG: polysaccharide deacetylase family protein [Bacteroidetes bacterium]|nr:polysaccharide deacetylase family protein [Bacteroidota bacterium]
MKKLLVLLLIWSSLFLAQIKPSEKYIIIRCDDFGMCHSVNMAIKKVIESGIPLSTSVMFSCAWYQEAVSILKEHPEVGVGVHLTLNAEWKNYRWGPVTGKNTVPSLVDESGYFFPSRTKLFDNNPSIEEIEKELRAQIDRAMKSGIRIDYLDYHMGAAVQTNELRRLVENLAKEYGLGMSGYFGEIYSSITYGAPLGTKSDSLMTHIRKLEPGVNLQVCHLGLDSSEMQALKDMNEFGLAEMSKHREEELMCLLNPELPDLFAEKNIIPITYKQLIEKMGLEKMYRSEDSDY